MTQPLERPDDTDAVENPSFGHDDPVLQEPGSAVAPLALPEELLEWW